MWASAPWRVGCKTQDVLPVASGAAGDNRGAIIALTGPGSGGKSFLVYAFRDMFRDQSETPSTAVRVPEGETSRGGSREVEGRSTYPMRMGKVSANLSLAGAGGRDLARRKS